VTAQTADSALDLQALAEVMRGAADRPPRLALRVTEAAAALGVSVDYFTTRIAPDLRIVRDGRTKLVPVTEITRWLEKNAAYALGDR
jgi:hypothetical protein